MRRFEIHRDRDVSGISGTGVVAEGVQFTNGWCSISWLGEFPSAVLWPGGISHVEHVHCHGGASRIVWLDDEHGQPYVQPKTVYREPRMAPQADPLLVGFDDLAEHQREHAKMMKEQHG